MKTRRKFAIRKSDNFLADKVPRPFDFSKEPILWLVGAGRGTLSFDLGSAWPVCHAMQDRCGADATRI